MSLLSPKNKRIFLISNYSVKDETYIRSLIYALGGEVTDLSEKFHATHLVVPYLRATPKMMAALAAGLWIVQTSYVLESSKLGHWDYESDYEIGSQLCPYSILNECDIIPSRRKYEEAPRICREKALVKNRPNFSDWKVGLVVENKTTRLFAKRILQAGGAVVLVLTLPINIDLVDLSFIDFVVVKVKDLTSVAPLKERDIRCISYSFIADSLCKDPTPDIDVYDCHLQAERECRNKKKQKTKEHDRSPDGTDLNMNEVCPREADCSRKDLQITLNNFLLNTAISVTVDFNPRLMPKVGVNNIEESVSERVDLISKPSQCSQNIKMGEYYSQSSFIQQKERSRNSSSAEKWVHHSEIDDFKNENCSQSRSTKKRVLSPQNGMSPNKRRKTFTPQKNKIFKYLIQTDGIKTEKTEVRDGIRSCSFLDTSSDFADGVNCKGTNRSRVVKTLKNGDNSVRHHSERACVPEVIVISSDEETDSPVRVTSDKDREKVWESANLIVNESRNIDSSVCVVSDEEDDSYLSTQNIIDLTCDNFCGLDDAGGVIVPESKQFKKSLLDNDYDDDDCDDDCISEISYKRKKENSVEDMDVIDQDFPYPICERKNETCSSYVPTCANVPTRKATSSESGSLKDNFSSSQMPSSISHDEPVPNVEEICSKVEFIDLCESEGSVSDVPLQNEDLCESEGSVSDVPLQKEDLCESEGSVSDVPLQKENLCESERNVNDVPWEMEDLCESERNVSDVPLEMDDGNSSDSSLPSPPHIFEDNANFHDTSTKENCQIALCPESSKGMNSEYTQFTDDQNYFCEQAESYLTQVKAPLQEPITYVRNQAEMVLGNDIKSQLCETRAGLQNDEDDVFEEIDNRSVPKTVSPSAMRVCQVQADVLLSKLLQPWIDLETDHICQCYFNGAAGCNSVHGKKEVMPEEVEFYDEAVLLRMDCGSAAVDLVQNRLDCASYPTPAVVQYFVICCMDLWVEGLTDAICWLRDLLDLHPPCAIGMLDYYKKILFNPVKKMRAPDGIFWCCVIKIEELINAIENQSAESRAECPVSSDTPTEDEDPFDFVKKFIESATSSSSAEKEMQNVKPSEKLKQLFYILDYFIRIMEADLNMGLLKNISNLKRYICKTGRPLIAVALWGTHGTVGNVNMKCRHIMKMYFRLFESYHDDGYYEYFRRLVSLMAGVIYASDTNTEPPMYPNIGYNCKELASSFAAVMMTTALNMEHARRVVNSLRPDWLRICVCSSLLERLYGRIMEISLQPYVTLLENLYALNQNFPSEEEISKTLIGDTDSDSVTHKDSEELSPELVKKAAKRYSTGETRLHVACRLNKVSEVEELLSVPDISINAKDNMGWTPLHEAAYHGSVECVKRLLNFRTPSGGPAVDLRAKNNLGVTPLMDAVQAGKAAVVTTLLHYGGRELLSDKDDSGKSVWDMASSEMKNILMDASDCGKENDLTIPRTLYVKLAVLTPEAILSYIRFSEVTKIVKYLKNSTELTRDGATLVKFQPIAFKQDYIDFEKLQSFLREALNNRSKLIETLVFFI